MTDPGRQPERTRLAWRRTVLGFTAVTLLAGRLAIQRPGTVVPLLALAAILLGWLAVLALSWRRIVAMSTSAPAPARRVLPLTAGAALWMAGLGAALVFSR